MWLVVVEEVHVCWLLGTTATCEWSWGGSLEQEFTSTGELAPPSPLPSPIHSAGVGVPVLVRPAIRGHSFIDDVRL